MCGIFIRKKDLGIFHGSFSGLADIHGCVAVKITPVDDHPEYENWRPWQKSTDDSSSEMSPLFWIIIPAAAIVFFLFGFLISRLYYRRRKGEPLLDENYENVQGRGQV